MCIRDRLIAKLEPKGDFSKFFIASNTSSNATIDLNKCTNPEDIDKDKIKIPFSLDANGDGVYEFQCPNLLEANCGIEALKQSIILYNQVEKQNQIHETLPNQVQSNVSNVTESCFDTQKDETKIVNSTNLIKDVSLNSVNSIVKFNNNLTLTNNLTTSFYDYFDTLSKLSLIHI